MVKVEKKIFPKKKFTGKKSSDDDGSEIGSVAIRRASGLKKSDRRSEIVARRAAILGGMSLTY